MICMYHTKAHLNLLFALLGPFTRPSGTEKVMHYYEARSALMIFLINAQRLSRIDRITGACICICIYISRTCRSHHRGLYDAGGRACQPSESAKWAANTVDFGQNNQNQAFSDMLHIQWIHYAYMVTFYYFANTSSFFANRVMEKPFTREKWNIPKYFQMFTLHSGLIKSTWSLPTPGSY